MRTAASECNLHCQEVFLNTEFLEEAMAKAEVFFKHVVLPELMTGHVQHVLLLMMKKRVNLNSLVENVAESAQKSQKKLRK